ncbi:MAG TPA: hypothetical protein PK691_08255, partial [Thermomicrobiales bacterium]|nr:hypothetical protein [Thermomicrobiales bacterium]
LGFGMSFIWAPMTTAMLNSVDSSKSGVASAINGAIREIGTAFGIAYLGTVANRLYQTSFAADPGIKALRADQPDSQPLQGIIDMVGHGATLAGSFIYAIPGYDQIGDAVDTIRNASSIAFVEGMNRAVVIGSVALIAASVVSYFLISDAAHETELSDVPLPAIEPIPSAAD